MSFIDNLCKQLFPEDDELNNPDYYQVDGQDSMDFIMGVVEKNAKSFEEGIYLFNNLKYMIRYSDKNGLEDLYKARDYLNRIIGMYE